MAESRFPHLLPRLTALFVTFLWSTSWVLIKFGLEDLPALGFAGLRYGLAFAVLAALVMAHPDRRSEIRRLGRTDWLRLSMLGVVFYTLTQGAQFFGLSLLPAVTLSLVLSFTPAAVGLLGATFLGERLGAWQWIGVAAFLIGALVYFLPLHSLPPLLGLAVAAFGLVANAAASLLGRAVNRSGDLHPLVVTVVSMGVGSLLLLLTGATVEGIPNPGLSGWAIILWLAVVNTALAFTLWNDTLSRLSAVESTLINNTMLIQIAILAWAFLGEPISLREGAGLVIAAAGVLFLQLAPSQTKV